MMPTRNLLLAAAALLVCGCQSATTIDPAVARDAASLEVQVDGDGNLCEVEYHLAPSKVPENIRKAMLALHPGAQLTDAEREENGGEWFWELAGQTGGYEVEAMFHADGSLHSEEIQVPADRVPGGVRESIARLWPGAPVKAWEEIRNEARAILEYHVKLESGAWKLKVMVAPNGSILGAVREIASEIEVPIPLESR